MTIKKITTDVPVKRTVELYPVYVISPDAVEKIPSADVAEVVRCKDCRFHTTDPECFDEFEITDKPMMCVGIRYGGVDPDWFCEHGERMDGE